MTKQLESLLRFVASDGRVHPTDWNGFYKKLSSMVPVVPVPLILGGSIASDQAKRVRLLQQIQAVRSSNEAMDFADTFLRSLPEHGWKWGDEPPSNRDSYGNEDCPAMTYALLLR